MKGQESCCHITHHRLQLTLLYETPLFLNVFLTTLSQGMSHWPRHFILYPDLFPSCWLIFSPSSPPVFHSLSPSHLCDSHSEWPYPKVRCHCHLGLQGVYCLFYIYQENLLNADSCFLRGILKPAVKLIQNDPL